MGGVLRTPPIPFFRNYLCEGVSLSSFKLSQHSQQIADSADFDTLSLGENIAWID